MLRYAKRLGRKIRRFVRNEVGQNVIETALIIGVVSLVLVLGFMSTGVLAAVQDVGNQVVCEAQNGTWADNGKAVGSCT